MRNVGAMAESQLELWASQVGITCNKANMDLEGWDFFLQFPFLVPVNHEAADRVRPRTECLIQVKGFGSSQVRKGIKLSNLQKLVFHSLPVFFLLLRYSDGNDLVSAHLVHLDESLITRALKRLRSISAEKNKKLNKRYMYLTWTNEQLLQSFDGQGLMAAIQQHIGEGMDEYINRKMMVRETAGDPIPAIVRSTFEFGSNEQAWTELVDFAIGLRDSLSAAQLVIEEDVRFNVPFQKKELGEGTIKFTPPNIECVLLFHDKNRKIEVSYPANLYTPRWFFGDCEIPPDYQKYRATFNLGEVVIMPGLGQGNINVSFPSIEHEFNIEEIYNNWRLVDLFNQNETIYITVTVLHEEKDYVIPLTFDDRSFLSESDVEIWDIVESTHWLTQVLDLPPDISLSISQLMNQRETINLLRMIYDRSQPITSLTVDILDEHVEKVLNKELVIPVVRALRLGGKTILVTGALAGLPSLTGNSHPGYKHIELASARVIILEHREYSSDSDMSIKSIVEKLEERLDSDGYNYVSNI